MESRRKKRSLAGRPMQRTSTKASGQLIHPTAQIRTTQLEETAVGSPLVLNLFMLFSAHYGSVESAVKGRTSSPQLLITSHVDQLGN
jgi:hypothetical protein